MNWRFYQSFTRSYLQHIGMVFNQDQDDHFWQFNSSSSSSIHQPPYDYKRIFGEGEISDIEKQQIKFLSETLVEGNEYLDQQKNGKKSEL